MVRGCLAPDHCRAFRDAWHQMIRLDNFVFLDATPCGALLRRPVSGMRPDHKHAHDAQAAVNVFARTCFWSNHSVENQKIVFCLAVCNFLLPQLRSSCRDTSVCTQVLSHFHLQNCAETGCGTTWDSSRFAAAALASPNLGAHSPLPNALHCPAQTFLHHTLFYFSDKISGWAVCKSLSWLLQACSRAPSLAPTSPPGRPTRAFFHPAPKNTRPHIPHLLLHLPISTTKRSDGRAVLQRNLAHQSATAAN